MSKDELDADDDETFACDDLEYYVNELGMTPSEALDSALDDSYAQGRRAALEWAAVQVGTAGCSCKLGGQDDSEWILAEGDRWIVDIHDPACPRALAAKIRIGML